MAINPVIVAGDLFAFAPELDGKLDEQAVGEIIAWANEDAQALSDDPQAQRLVRIYLAAHFGLLTTKARAGAAGPVESEAAGGLRRTYATFKLNTQLGLTLYGQLYLALVERSYAARTWILL